MRFLSRFPARRLTAFAAITGSLSVLSVARSVAAEPTFPSVIEKVYGGDCAAQCTLCHTRPEGGSDYLQPSLLDETYAAKNVANTGEGSFFANLINVAVSNHVPVPSSDQSLETATHTYPPRFLIDCRTISLHTCRRLPAVTMFE